VYRQEPCSDLRICVSMFVASCHRLPVSHGTATEQRSQLVLVDCDCFLTADSRYASVLQVVREVMHHSKWPRRGLSQAIDRCSCAGANQESSRNRATAVGNGPQGLAGSMMMMMLTATGRPAPVRTPRGAPGARPGVGRRRGPQRVPSLPRPNLADPGCSVTRTTVTAV
jgi:hypothetical protein